MCNNIDVSLVENVGSILRYLRQRDNMTLYELSSNCGVSKSYISEVERGIYNLTLNKFESICKGLGYNPSDVRYMITLYNSNNSFIKSYKTVFDCKEDFKRENNSPNVDIKFLLKHLDLFNNYGIKVNSDVIDYLSEEIDSMLRYYSFKQNTVL